MRELVHAFLKWFPTALGGGTVAVSAVWQGARDSIGNNVALVWQAMSDPWIAFALLAVLAAYVAAIVWTGRKPEVFAEPAVVVHRIEPDPFGDMVRRMANRPYVPSPRKRLNDAVLALRHVVNAREMWWATVHQRNGPSPLGTRLLDAIDAIRQCFPPGAEGSWEEDQISRLHSAAARYGQELGIAEKETDRLKLRRDNFEAELAATIARFDALGRRQNESASDD